MVRVWKPGGAEPAGEVRGTAVHIASGRQVTFSDPAQLIRFLGGPEPALGEPASMDRHSDGSDQET
jgi:hypothetical protein